MPLFAKHRSRSLKRRQVVRWQASLPRIESAHWDRATIGLALFLTIIFHSGLVVYAPRCFLKKSSEIFSVELATPANDIFVETNPAAESTPPPNTAFFSSQDQRAAQPDPDTTTNTAFPHQNEGELEAHKIVQGEDATMQSQPQSSLTETQEEKETLAETTLSNENVEMPSDISVEKAPSRPKPQSRPQIASTTVNGPLKKTNGGTQHMGLRAVDARFTQYGEYIQRLMEAISSQWSLLYREAFRSIPDRKTYIVVAFDINSQGQIIDLRIEQSTASQPALLLIKDAILSSAPYGSWTEDMVKTLGNIQTIKIRCLY